MNPKHKKHEENYTNYSKLYYNEFLISSDNFFKKLQEKKKLYIQNNKGNYRLFIRNHAMQARGRY